jgi:hypothetical protein
MDGGPNTEAIPAEQFRRDHEDMAKKKAQDAEIRKHASKDMPVEMG